MVDEIQVDICNSKLWCVSHDITVARRGNAHVLKAILDGCFDVQSVEPRVLGRDENILSRETALPQGSPDLFFVAVRLSGIWMDCVSRERIY